MLNTMVTEVVKRLINVNEYYKMAEVGILKPDDRVELINGEIFQIRKAIPIQKSGYSGPMMRPR